MPDRKLAFLIFKPSINKNCPQCKGQIFLIGGISNAFGQTVAYCFQASGIPKINSDKGGPEIPGQLNQRHGNVIENGRSAGHVCAAALIAPLGKRVFRRQSFGWLVPGLASFAAVIAARNLPEVHQKARIAVGFLRAEAVKAVSKQRVLHNMP